MKAGIKYVLMGLIKPILTPLTKNYTYRDSFGGVSIKLKGGLGFLCAKHHPTPEENFLSNLELKGKTIYDIGGYIGVLTIFFAKTSGESGKVITFEPNPKSYAKIKENVALNNLDNVQILNIGIADKRETKTLVARSSVPGTGSMEKNIQQCILKEKSVESLQVEVDTLDCCIETNKLPKPNFIKIDIEGMEYSALLGMRETIGRDKPSLYIEIHGTDKESKIANIRRIVKFLDLNEYSIYHVESGQVVTNDNAQIAREGHIFCK